MELLWPNWGSWSHASHHTEARLFLPYTLQLFVNHNQQFYSAVLAATFLLSFKSIKQ